MGLNKQGSLKVSSFVLVAVSVCLSACGSSNDKGVSTGGGGASSEVTECKNGVPVSGKPGWVQCPDSISGDGNVKVSRQVMRDDEEDKTRQSYQRTNLLQIAVDAKYNASIFQISGPEEYKNKAFIAPRIYAYGSQEGGSRTSPKENADGSMTISFNVIFVDGLSSEIPGADGSTKVKLPPNFQVKDPDGLRQVLRDEFQATNGLAPLPGCPKRIVVKVADAEYDASASDLSQGDNCQINTPTTVSVTLSKSDAQYMLERALYDNLVDVHATYETRVSFPVANVSISFDRASIYDALRAELAVKVPPYVDADAQLAITHVMKSQLMKVSIQGDTSGLLDKLIAQVSAEFFEPFVPNPQDSLSKCPDGVMVCVRFSYNEQKQSDSLTFSWDQSTNAMIGQNYLTWTKLSPIEDAVNVGSPVESCQSPANPQGCSDFSNKTGLAYETGLTVVAGNLLVIRPNFVVEESRPSTQGTTTRVDNNVCVAQHEIIGHACGGHAHGDGGGPGACTDYGTGKFQCDRYQDQWTETTTYYEGRPEWELNSNPIGLMQELFDGLTARFVWTDSKTGRKVQKDCPLSAFNRLGDGKTLQVHLDNAPSCQVFTSDARETPMLYLMNNIQFQQPFTNGSRITKWDGSVTQTPDAESFYPEVKFAGTVSVRGYGFQGVSSNGGI